MFLWVLLRLGEKSGSKRDKMFMKRLKVALPKQRTAASSNKPPENQPSLGQFSKPSIFQGQTCLLLVLGSVTAEKIRVFPKIVVFPPKSSICS